MTQKTYYYHFNPFDTTFWAMIMALIIALTYTCCCCFCGWGLFIITALLWCYKHIKHKAVVMTDKTIKIDYCAPLAFKDIKKAEVKTVQMGCKKYKILSLIPKEKVKYSYNWLQKHNCTFGPFAIALYGIMTPKDEKEIVKIVKSKVSK